MEIANLVAEDAVVEEEGGEFNEHHSNTRSRHMGRFP